MQPIAVPLKKFLALIFVMVLIFSFVGCGSNEQQEIVNEPPTQTELPVPAPEEIEQQPLPLSEKIDAFLTEEGFWGTVLVMRGDEVILRRAYGMADATHYIENTIYTPIYLASVSKQFTGAAVLILEAEGRLSSADTLDMFFPGHDGLENVTVADLLAMRSGLGCYIEFAESILPPKELDGAPRMLSAEDIENLLEAIEAHILRMSMWSPDMPDDYYRFRYSNAGYFLLGRIIGQVSGMSYTEFIEERIFVPVGMTNSGFVGEFAHASIPVGGFMGMYGMAMPHDALGRAITNRWILRFFDTAYSSGNIVSTVDDLSLWIDAFFGGKLFDESMLDMPIIGTYFYGWNVEMDRAVWHHGGGGPGSLTWLAYDREQNIRIILLSNKRSGDRNAVWIEQIYEWVSAD